MLILINYIFLSIHIKNPKIKTSETIKKYSAAKTTETAHSKQEPKIKYKTKTVTFSVFSGSIKRPYRNTLTSEF